MVISPGLKTAREEGMGSMVISPYLRMAREGGMVKRSYLQV